MDKWEEFYSPYFSSSGDLKDFISECESLNLDDKRHRAKLMMHQGQRLISLANNSECMDIERDPLKLLFLLIAVEAVSKLHDNFTKSGCSKQYVLSFFEKFTTDDEKDFIRNNIEICRKEDTTLEDIIKILYSIRCDVVHEGKYWSFDFASKEHRSILTFGDGEQMLRVKILYEGLRDIIINSIVKATKEILRI